jgi:micrococcal nuclease
MNKGQKIYFGVIVSLLVLATGGSGYTLMNSDWSQTSTTLPSPTLQLTKLQNLGVREKAKVKRVVDGDTIELEDGRTVRYIGMDTPETKHPTKGVQCFGKEASARNKELVDGKEIGLEKDVSETDRYQRILRYIYVGDVLINEQLVREGYAFSYSYPPDVKYQDRMVAAQKIAYEQELGLWKSCKVGNDQRSILGYATE